MNAIRVTSQRHHCVHEVNGHSSDVVCKNIFHSLSVHLQLCVPHPVQQRCPSYISVFWLPKTSEQSTDVLSGST